MREEIQDAVLALIAEARRRPDDDPDAFLEPELDARLGELGMDSLKLVEIIFELETEFCVEADEELLAELETVSDIVELIVEAREAGQEELA